MNHPGLLTEYAPAAALPDMKLDEASDLWQGTDYAFDACETESEPINSGDAAAFFLEGYEYARRMLSKIGVPT